jgi:hypothetical protein
MALEKGVYGFLVNGWKGEGLNELKGTMTIMAAMEKGR